MGDTRRTVVTTGANSGIGLATVLELARRGMRSVGTVRSAEKADAVAKAAADAGVEVETALLDVTDADACREVVDRFRPWGIVNNAGSPHTGAVEDVDDDEARELFESMVLAPVRLARLALPHMREAGDGGRIVNISSLMGKATFPLSGWYQASKHALEAVSDALRMEVARDGIDVVLIEPGGIKTGLWEQNRRSIEARGESRYSSSYERLLSLVRLTHPAYAASEHCARTIASALTARHPRSRYVVGPDAQAALLLGTFAPTVVKDRVSRALLRL